MFENLRSSKKTDEKGGSKATDRLAYMSGSVPAWETAGMGIQRSRNFSSLMNRFNGWVYGASMINARGVASQPIKLYSRVPENGAKSIIATRKIGNQKSAYLQGKLENKPSAYVQRKAYSGEVVEVIDHPIIDLLENPSPEMDGYTLAMQRMLNLQLTGNAYLHPIISETLGVPIELWNMQSDLVQVIPDGTMDLVDFYKYGKLPSSVEFRKDEVLHEKVPNPSDPFYGKGWVSACLDAVDLLHSMDEYEQSVLDNQARPDWAVMVKEHLTDSQYQRLLQQIERQLGGKNNRSRPFIFEGGTSGMPMSFSPTDLAFDTGENRKIEVVSAISGVPVSKLKANDPNLANAREGNMGWLRDTIVPYLTMDESFLNRQLLPMFGEYADNLFLAYDDPISADRSVQANIDSTDASAGIRTRNEIRADRGLEPMEGGDELLVPMGMVTLEQALNPVPSYGMFNASPEVKADEDPGSMEAPVSEVVEMTEAEVEGLPKQVEPSSALNGAQVTSALEIVNLVTLGQMPRESAIGQLMVFFNLTNDQAENIMGDVGKGFEPKPLESNETVTLSATKAEECLQNKIPILMEEGYEREQAVAIAYSMCYEGKSELDANTKNADCGCSSDYVCQKTALEKSRSLVGSVVIGAKQSPVDRGNIEWGEMMDLTSIFRGDFKSELVRIFKSEIMGWLDGGMAGDFITSAMANQEIEKASSQFVNEVMLQSGQLELDKLGTGLVFNKLDPLLANTITDYVDQLKETLIVGTPREVRSKIELGMRHGMSTDEIKREIESLLLEEPDTGIIPIVARAEMIVRTEVAMINEIGRLEGWKQSGVVKGKQWQVSAGACEFCTTLAGLNENPIGLNDVFASATSGSGTYLTTASGKKMKIWRDLQTAPLHPNCRCRTIEVLYDDDEFDEKDLIEGTRQQEFEKARNAVLAKLNQEKITRDQANEQIRKLEEMYGRKPQ